MDGDNMRIDPGDSAVMDLRKAAALPARPAPRLPPGVAALWQPLLIFAGMQFAAVLASVLLTLWRQPPDPAFELSWDTAQRWSLLASMLLPLLLAAAPPRPAHPLRRLTPAYLLFVALVSAAAWIDGSLQQIGAAWLALWLLCGWIASAALLMLFARGTAPQAVAVVGMGPDTDRLVQSLQQQHPQIDLLGVFDDRDTRWQGLTHLSRGSVSDLIELGKRRNIDWILVSLPHSAEARVIDIVEHLKSLAVPVGLSPAPLTLQQMRHEVGYVADHMPVTVLADRPIRRWGRVIKALEDYLLGGLITLLLLPLMALIALAVKLDSRGPVLFRQPRHGCNNREFHVLKFRTMRWDPQGQRQPLAQTARDDARITPLGRLLRRSSLDELPQLFNVLRGDMSLVGPRPHAVDMRTEERLGAEIVATYAQRHRVLPGLTGWAQVSGYRGATDTVGQLRRRVELDLEYIDRWSIWLDLKILIMTSWIVIRGTNAY